MEAILLIGMSQIDFGFFDKTPRPITSGEASKLVELQNRFYLGRTIQLRCSLISTQRHFVHQERFSETVRRTGSVLGVFTTYSTFTGSIKVCIWFIL